MGMGDRPGIEILEKVLVTPKEATPAEEIWLSNLDLLVARAHAPTIYFYRRPLNAAGYFSPTALKVSLSRALVPFYPLAGRLVSGADGRLCIRCTADGVLFVVARSELALDDFGDFAPSEHIRRLLVPSVDAADKADIPLFMFQLTFFRCGGVCLGAAIHHTAVDGTGAIHFINAWAGFSRDINHDPSPPFFDRASLRSRSPPSITSTHIEYTHSSPTPTSQPSHFTSIILKLSKHQLSILKSATNKPISTFKAVVAHVWRCACKANGLEPTRRTRLYMTVDARSRLRPPLPPTFVGNAIFRASAESTVGEVVAGTVEFVARRIDAVTSRLDDEFVRSLLDCLETKVEVATVRKGSWVMPAADLWVISWHGLPIYDADFGWGKPIYMGRACLQFSGLVYIVPSSPEEEAGGLSVVVAVEPDKAERFEDVFYEELGRVGPANL